VLLEILLSIIFILFQRCKARIKENRDRTVNNVRFHNSYKADLLVVLGKSEPHGIWSARYESEGRALTKEGNTFHLKHCTDVFFITGLPSWELCYKYSAEHAFLTTMQCIKIALYIL
jgi:hypothetical protein